MNSHLNKEIFSETGCINKEVLLRYRDAKLRDSEKHEVEKHLVDCLLCTEALEGFALFSGTASFDEVNKRLAKLAESNQTFSMNRYAAIAASVAAILILTYYTYKQFNDTQVERIASSEMTNEFDTVIQSEPVQSTETPIGNSDSIVSEVENDSNDLFRKNSSVAQSSQRQVAVASDVAAGNTEQDAEPLSFNEVETAEMAQAEGIQADEIKEDNIYLSTEKPTASGYTSNISYVDNRKIIDYKELKKDKSSGDNSNKSLPSAHENQQKKAEEERSAIQTGMEVTRPTTYAKLIESPIKLYNNGNYTGAIKGFDEILDINHGDENARFYKGMSLYYLKKYDDAIGLLLPLSKINTQPFSEEALFYTGKSFAAKKENNMAITIFRKIVSDNGFYSDKAKIELKKLQ